MKKILMMAALALSCYCISCNTKSESSISPATQKNLDAMHGVSNSFETKDFSKLGDYIASDAVDHSGENGDIKGLDSIKAAFVKEAADFDNMKTDIIKELADDEYVMSWEHFTATFKVDAMGHKAGDKFDMKDIEVVKFKDGKGTEHWSMMEPGDVAKMMSAMQPQMGMPMDSAKKKM